MIEAAGMARWASQTAKDQTSLTMPAMLLTSVEHIDDDGKEQCRPSHDGRERRVHLNCPCDNPTRTQAAQLPSLLQLNTRRQSLMPPADWWPKSQGQLRRQDGREGYRTHSMPGLGRELLSPDSRPRFEALAQLDRSTLVAGARRAFAVAMQLGNTERSEVGSQSRSQRGSEASQLARGCKCEVGHIGRSSTRLQRLQRARGRRA